MCYNRRVRSHHRWIELLFLVMLIAGAAYLARPAPPPPPPPAPPVAVATPKGNSGDGLQQVVVVLERASRPPRQAAETVIECLWQR